MRGGTAGLFNATSAAAALVACDELGLLDELERDGVVEARGFCRTRDLHRESLVALAGALERFGIVTLEGKGPEIGRGPAFSEAYRDKGFFLWLVRGYGAMLTNLAGLVRNANRVGSFVPRDGKYIAMACRDYGARFVDSHVTALLDGEPFSEVADLGCGSAERLIGLVKARPGVRGLGIDVEIEAVKFAQEGVEAAGLQNRIRISHADLRDLTPGPELARADVLLCFFLGHDFWPRPRCVDTLRRIRHAFPRARRFLLCDTFRVVLPPSTAVPIFTLGFELIHAVMGQYVPSREEWLSVFPEAGWTCVGEREVGIPFSGVFDLRASA